jgi:hypothetical protein
MDPAKYEFQSEFARRYIALGKEQGKAEGKAEGRVDLVKRLLALRFGALPSEAAARVAAASIDELDAIGDGCLRHRRSRTRWESAESGTVGGKKTVARHTFITA